MSHRPYTIRTEDFITDMRAETHFTVFRGIPGIYFTVFRVTPGICFTVFRVKHEIYFTVFRVTPEMYFTVFRVNPEIYFTSFRVNPDIYFTVFRVTHEIYFMVFRVTHEIYFNVFRVISEIFFTVFRATPVRAYLCAHTPYSAASQNSSPESPRKALRGGISIVNLHQVCQRLTTTSHKNEETAPRTRTGYPHEGPSEDCPRQREPSVNRVLFEHPPRQLTAKDQPVDLG